MLYWKWILQTFYYENLPDRAVEPNQFHEILDVAKVLGSRFTIPSRNKIGGGLFSSNLILFHL